MEQERIDTINIIGCGVGCFDAPKNVGKHEQSWGVNRAILRNRVDVGFDMHDEKLMKPHQLELRREIIPYVTAMNIPVYSVWSITNTTYIRYPIEEIIKRFRTGYFSNAICYMIALALYKGVKHLKFYGVSHLKSNSEYYKQKPGVDFWLGVATGMGVTYYVNGNYCEIGRLDNGIAYGYGLEQDQMIEKYGRLP